MSLRITIIIYTANNRNSDMLISLRIPLNPQTQLIHGITFTVFVSFFTTMAGLTKSYYTLYQNKTHYSFNMPTQSPPLFFLTEVITFFILDFFFAITISPNLVFFKHPGGTFVSDTGGTFIPILSTYPSQPPFAFSSSILF